MQPCGSGSGRRRVGAALLLAALAFGCEKDRWQADSSLRAPDEDVLYAFEPAAVKDGRLER